MAVTEQGCCPHWDLPSIGPTLWVMTSAPEPGSSYYPPPPAAPPGSPQQSYNQTPQALSEASEVSWATAAHLSALAGWVVFGIFPLGPFIIYLMQRDRGPFIKHHATEALNASISYFGISLLLSIPTGIFTFVTLGLGAPLLVLPAVIGSVFWIIAAVRANAGEWYRYPFIVRLVN